MKRKDRIRCGKALWFTSLWLLFLLVVPGGNSLVYAGDESHSWKRDVEIRVGYGDNFANTKTDIQYWAIFPGMRWRFYQKHFDNGAFLNLSAIGEAALLQFFKPEGAVGLGLTPWLRIDLEYKSFIYYLQAGSGGIWTNLDVYELGQEFNFTPQGEIGVEYAFSDKFHFNLGARYFHMSNAGLSKHNQGVNEIMGVAGISLPF